MKQKFSKMESLNAVSKPNLAHIQSFYVVAKHGSLGAAARAGGVSLATLGRHITALEKELKVLLFNRRGNGFFLTKNGAQLFDYANEVEIAVHDLSLQQMHETIAFLELSASQQVPT